MGALLDKTTYVVKVYNVSRYTIILRASRSKVSRLDHFVERPEDAVALLDLYHCLGKNQAVVCVKSDTRRRSARIARQLYFKGGGSVLKREATHVRLLHGEKCPFQSLTS